MLGIFVIGLPFSLQVLFGDQGNDFFNVCSIYFLAVFY